MPWKFQNHKNFKSLICVVRLCLEVRPVGIDSLWRRLPILVSMNSSAENREFSPCFLFLHRKSILHDTKILRQISSNEIARLVRNSLTKLANYNTDLGRERGGTHERGERVKNLKWKFSKLKVFYIKLPINSNLVSVDRNFFIWTMI